MNQREGEALDRMLTEPPRDCNEDGHDWRSLGADEDGTVYLECRCCGEEDEQ